MEAPPGMSPKSEDAWWEEEKERRLAHGFWFVREKYRPERRPIPDTSLPPRKRRREDDVGDDSPQHRSRRCSAASDSRTPFLRNRFDQRENGHHHQSYSRYDHRDSYEAYDPARYQPWNVHAYPSPHPRFSTPSSPPAYSNHRMSYSRQRDYRESNSYSQRPAYPRYQHNYDRRRSSNDDDEYYFRNRRNRSRSPPPEPPASEVQENAQTPPHQPN